MNEILAKLIGTTITDVRVAKTSDGGIFEIEIEANDGTVVILEPTTYNYGPQEIRVNER